MTNDNPTALNSLNAVHTLRKVLTDLGWNPLPDKETASFIVDLGPPHVPVVNVYAAISIALEQFVFYINFGVEAPAEHRDELARLLARVNWLLMIGSFEMDYGDGHIRFRSGIDFKGMELSETLIFNTILYAMNAVERYADALISVAVGDKAAAQAIEDAESHADTE